jgi:predicted kinase
VRVNRDDLRAMLHNSAFSGDNEKVVERLEELIVRQGLERGQTVIVDDTNIHPKTFQRWKNLATELGITSEVADFTDVPYSICVARNACRTKPVPDAAMKRMHKLLLPELHERTYAYRPYDPDLPDAVLCDLDGTMAIHGDRDPYDGSRAGEDRVNEPVVWLLRMILHLKLAKLIAVSARDDCNMGVTDTWIREKAVPGITLDESNYMLLMRKTGDKRDDSIAKKEIYQTHIEGKYNVRVVFDDRARVVKLWRSLGLPCFAVAAGDF